jgi:hypothetical protein
MASASLLLFSGILQKKKMHLEFWIKHEKGSFNNNKKYEFVLR